MLLANDAAGEGVNLQRAHLMVNYDLPWNPNRLEQRFGRIHRIGQQEVCHLWNLLAQDTREGEVYIQLLEKLDNARKALGDKVFDVLGQLFTGRSLRELLMDAVRYNADPAVKARMQEIDEAVKSDHLLELLERRALVKQGMDTSKVRDLRQQMERAMARRVHPHYVHDFFLEAFRRLGGKAFPREEGRYEITHVSPQLLDRDQQIGVGVPVQPRYERICFEKEHVGQSPRAELVSPGHPLLEACISLIWERHGQVLSQGAVLIDDDDLGAEPRLLFCLEHGLQDGRQNRSGAAAADLQPAGVPGDRPLRRGEDRRLRPLSRLPAPARRRAGADPAAAGGWLAEPGLGSAGAGPRDADPGAPAPRRDQGGNGWSGSRRRARRSRPACSGRSTTGAASTRSSSTRTPLASEPACRPMWPRSAPSCW